MGFFLIKWAYCTAFSCTQEITAYGIVLVRDRGFRVLDNTEVPLDTGELISFLTHIANHISFQPLVLRLASVKLFYASIPELQKRSVYNGLHILEIEFC